jgi:outer membrane protein insertion porin family
LFSFTEPWIFNRPISAGFDAFHNTHDKSTDVGYAYDEKRTGGDLRLGREFGEYVKGDVMYKIENVDIRDIDESASNDLKKEEGSNVISSLTLGVSRDTRDNIYSPTRGTVLGGSVGCAGGPFGGDKNFVRITANASQYVSFFKKAVLELSLRGGIVDPFSDSDDVPIYERFFAGGADTIRGYKERAVGPVDTVTREPLGGEATLIGNLEVTYPLLDFIKGAVFYDIGNVWAKVSDFGKGNFYSGFGVGVRVKTPIGPIKLDYGWPTKLAPGEDKKEGQFHFSMSHGF